MRLFLRKGMNFVMIEREWTINQVMDANDALDIEDELERRLAQKMRDRQQ
jgi:hypothetical protein